MKKALKPEEIQARSLLILDYLHQLCEKNGIRYALIGGALLGAAHYQGFIEQDDDIDLGLLRPEYERLIELLKHQTDFPLLALEVGNSPYLFAKVTDSATVQRSSHLELNGYGVYVDLFPFDVLPADEKDWADFRQAVRRNGAIKSSFKAKLTSNRWREVLVKAVLYTPGIIYNRLRFGSMQNRLLQVKKRSGQFAETGGKWCAFIASKYGDKDTVLVEQFKNLQPIVFEGKTYWTLGDYPTYLQQMYGPWQPEKSHQTHRYYQFYWRKKK